MDRRTFALGLSALTAATAARAQSASPADPAAPLPSAFVEEQQATGLAPAEFALSRKLELLRTIPGRLQQANIAETLDFVDDLPVERTDWLYFDDGIAFDSLFGDNLSDDALIELVGALDQTGDTRSTAAAEFAGSLPPGYVAYQALTRYAYISGAAPAGAGGQFGDYAVALTPGDTAETLTERLSAAQRSWRDYINRFGAGAVNRL